MLCLPLTFSTLKFDNELLRKESLKPVQKWMIAHLSCDKSHRSQSNVDKFLRIIMQYKIKIIAQVVLVGLFDQWPHRTPTMNDNQKLSFESFCCSSIAKQYLIYTLTETAFVRFVGWIGDTSTQQVPKLFGYFKWWSPNIIITSSKNDVLGLSEEKLKKREKMLTMWCEASNSISHDTVSN